MSSRSTVAAMPAASHAASMRCSSVSRRSASARARASARIVSPSPSSRICPVSSRRASATTMMAAVGLALSARRAAATSTGRMLSMSSATACRRSPSMSARWSASASALASAAALALRNSSCVHSKLRRRLSISLAGHAVSTAMMWASSWWMVSMTCTCPSSTTTRSSMTPRFSSSRMVRISSKPTVIDEGNGSEGVASCR